MAPPRIITRCDDLGSFRTANRAIRDACTDGIGRNVSVMANTAFVEEAAELLRDRDDICFGMHAVVNCEWNDPRHRFGPVLPPEQVPALMSDDGCTLVTEVQTLHERGAPFDQLMAEMKAQLAKLRGLGFDIRYVDTHCGFAWVHPPGEEDNRFSRTLTAWCVEEGLVYGDIVRATRLKPAGPDFAGVAQAIRELEDDTLHIMVNHPCYDVEEMQGVAHVAKEPGEVGAQRDRQRLNYMHPDIIKAVADRGVTLTRYDSFLK